MISYAWIRSSVSARIRSSAFTWRRLISSTRWRRLASSTRSRALGLEGVGACHATLPREQSTWMDPRAPRVRRAAALGASNLCICDDLPSLSLPLPLLAPSLLSARPSAQALSPAPGFPRTACGTPYAVSPTHYAARPYLVAGRAASPYTPCVPSVVRPVRTIVTPSLPFPRLPLAQKQLKHATDPSTDGLEGMDLHSGGQKLHAVVHGAYVRVSLCALCLICFLVRITFEPSSPGLRPIPASVDRVLGAEAPCASSGTPCSSPSLV